jgi:membrane protein DedA with SNARE-associated domain
MRTSRSVSATRAQGGRIDTILRTLADLPPLLIYLVIGTGAAIENVIPPVPADTFVLLGAFLSAAGRASAWVVFLVTWLCNIGSALGVYALARRYGQGFFQTAAGHWLLHPRQLEQIGRFYDRWGTMAIFGSRFLPAFRSMVPVFAGVTHVPFWRVAPPLAIASGLWYGALVFLGAAAGRNWEAILRVFGTASTALLVIATVLIAAFLVWWWRTRRKD